MQRGSVLPPQLVLPEKSLERNSWKLFVYKQDLVKSAVLRWRKKQVAKMVLTLQEKTDISFCSVHSPLGTC